MFEYFYNEALAANQVNVLEEEVEEKHTSGFSMRIVNGKSPRG